MELQIEILCCPVCKSKLFIRNNNLFCINNNCIYSKSPFIVTSGKNVLIDFYNSIVSKETLVKSSATSLVKRRNIDSNIKTILKRILNGSNSVSKDNFKLCSQLLKEIDSPKILIIGGGTIGAGSETIYKTYRESIISFDVYNSENVDFIADAHSIPLVEESIDLIIIQAILEHVISPCTVVNECFRVLKKNGLIYAETPFLQHVHEGPYDFSRFTMLGHRLLFKQFLEIRSGFVGGLGHSILWSIEYFVRGLFRNRSVGKIAKALFFWIRWFELIIPDSYNIDGACGSFFIGRKSDIVFQLNPENLVNEYRGAQK
jgi:SAM-dependent methyltransferase